MLKAEKYVKTPVSIEDELRSLFDPEDRLTILDIGACEGLDSVRYAKLFPQSKIYAFEPLEANIDKIRKYKKHFKTTNIEVVPQALSDKEGTATFHVSSGNPEGKESDEWDYGNKSSSLLPPDKKLHELHKWLKFEEKVEVATNTLNNFCQSYSIDEIDFIHMDVQGAELMVLKGAGDFLRRIKLIWMEVEEVSLYEQQPLKPEVQSFMAKNGFVKVKDTVNDISGDQLYVRADLKGAISDRKKKNNIIDKVRKKLRHKANSTAKDKSVAKLTYSQSGEDAIIQHLFGSLKIKNPSYLDIGAHHPYFINNTALFYKNGSKGINIEPDPSLFKEFTKQRKRDINLNVGIGVEKSEADFYIMSAATLNTFSKEEAERMERETEYKINDIVKLRLLTVNDVIKEHALGRFPELLSLDVEGLDEEILRSIDYSKTKPLVICVETITFGPKKSQIKLHSIEEFLTTQGYFKYSDTYINSIFVDKDTWYNS